ncbi:hypothetical protein [Zunongwangia mangrovi]|nr:hypothetical protein [Zunongwangia mangrovi]
MMKFLIAFIAQKNVAQNLQYGSQLRIEFLIILIAFCVFLVCMFFAHLVQRFNQAMHFQQRIDNRFRQNIKHQNLINNYHIQQYSVELYYEKRPKFWELVLSNTPLMEVLWFDENDYNTFFVLPMSHEEIKASQNTQS